VGAWSKARCSLASHALNATVRRVADETQKSVIDVLP
jgi:hypothetical protein